MRAGESVQSENRGTQGRRRFCAAWLLMLTLLGSLAPASPKGQDPAGGDTLQYPDPVLRARAEAAIRSEPYLVLDLAIPHLRLMLGGAVLRDYPIAAVEIGRPTVIFLRRSVVLPSKGRVWELSRLDPARTFRRSELQPRPPGEAVESPLIPPEPDEACPAPDVYLMRFEGGLSIEVRRDTPGRREPWAALAQGTRWKFRDLGQSISPHPEIRLRLLMAVPEAGALYRSLPLPTRLIVL